ncbi:MAG: hypothetical protein KGH54_04090, partial [Candidatus Micrarchaeota archaeon]|nr:hypothetical protein [Candidatus Micrarchaeota archaeon]
LSQLVSRIRKLPPKSIDELWYRNEFVFQDRGQNKALPRKAIDDLLGSDSAAEELATMLFMETHLDDMRKHLADIERENSD